MGDLLKNHEGKFVENVIFDSINAYVDTLNINDSNKLIALLEKVKIDKVPLSPFLDDLNQIMQRRHQIVHQMDRDDSLDPLTRKISSIDSHTVRKWYDITNQFNEQIFEQLNKLYKPTSET